MELVLIPRYNIPTENLELELETVSDNREITGSELKEHVRTFFEL